MGWYSRAESGHLDQPWPVAIRWCRRVLIAVLVGYCLTTLPGVRPHPGYSVWIDGWLQNGILVAATGLILARATWLRTARATWLLIGTGLGLYTAGNIVYFTYVQYLSTPPVPSVADIAFLASYVFLYAGIVSLVRHRVGRSERTLQLDGVVAALGLSALASVWLAYLLHVGTGSVLTQVVAMSYPVVDLVLLVLIVAACALLGGRPDRAMSYLGAGMVLFATADTIYTVRAALDTYVAGTPLDALWAVAAVFMAAAALRPDSQKVEARSDGWTAMAVPTLFTVSSVAVLVYATAQRVPVVTTVLATTTLAVGVVRAALSFREVQRLAASRAEARTDVLTGLGNRRHFQETVEARISGLTGGERLAVLLIDLDRFKEVNDSHGHSVGDALLVQVGERLLRQSRRGDVLVRMGGDEYAVMLHDVTPDEALQVAGRIRTSLQDPFDVDGIAIDVDSSIGIALCPDAGTTVSGLLHGADTAMYEAKVSRAGSLLFEAADDGLSSRRQLVQELHTGIAEGQLVLHYQPKFDLQTGLLSGAEALVRWNHPQRGLLFPDTFIPEAERYGLMRGLTTAVLALALDQAQEWLRSGLRFRVAVNVSAANLADTELPGQIEAMLAVRGLDGTALVVEVTETILMNDTARALAVLHGLCALGVQISIDDYGTGYSSLARLRDLPIHELKLDRSFVSELAQDARTAAIVESTIQLAHSLGLRLVAEGIETAEELDLLTAMGCDVGQGYHLARPGPAEQLLAHVTASLP